ncbi:MAG: acyl CoA:acetate/3-ketoacid CoA transferase, partial [Chloroflexota bacterium]
MPRTRRPRVVAADDIASLIDDGMTIASEGFSMMGVAEELYAAIEHRFLETGRPRGLTWFHAAGQSDRVHGIEHLAHPGLLRRIIGTHWGLAPRMSALIAAEELEAFCLPQGQVSHLFRAGASGEPGVITPIGLHTFLDPRQDGGKINRRARESGDDLIELVTIGGREYLRYLPIPFDLAIMRATTGDEDGNLSMEEEAVVLEAISIAQAARAHGGKVAAQVKHLAKAGTLHPKSVEVPGILVDYLVPCSDPDRYHRQTASYGYHPALSGELRAPERVHTPLPMGVRKVIGRRAVLEIAPDAVVNLGTGIPGDTIGPVAAEEGTASTFVLTIESGLIGGIPLGGADFGCGFNPTAIIDHAYQFDFYTGGGLDITFMGAAEVDPTGSVNASKLNGRALGCGGFIDITQSTRKVVYLLSFTSGGLDVEASGGTLRIAREGRHRKFVDAVSQITFNGRYARERRQEVLYITERCVLRLEEDGLTLVEIAPGIDLHTQVLAHLPAGVRISDALGIMDPRIFTD